MMQSIIDLLSNLEAAEIARLIGIPHDEARIPHFPQSRTSKSFDEFSRILENYYSRHFGTCVSTGRRLSPMKTTGKGKNIR